MSTGLSPQIQLHSFPDPAALAESLAATVADNLRFGTQYVRFATCRLISGTALAGFYSPTTPGWKWTRWMARPVSTLRAMARRTDKSSPMRNAAHS